MKAFSYPHTNLLGCLLSCTFLVAAFLLQHFQDLPPCPLCILQRWITGCLLVVFLMAWLHARSAFQNLFYGAITLLISSLGLFLSARHLWLIHHPLKEGTICTPNLSYLFKQLPLGKAAKTLFWGSGDCATMAGYFLGISIPLWTFSGFLILTLMSLWQLVRRDPSLPH